MPVFLFRESQCGGELGQLSRLLLIYLQSASILFQEWVTRRERITCMTEPRPLQSTPAWSFAIRVDSGFPRLKKVTC